ncbi:hypothetical protein LRE75_29140 [Streptomyces sp. 372A]
MTHTPNTEAPLTLEDAERLAKLADRALSLGLGTTTRSEIGAMIAPLMEGLNRVRWNGFPPEPAEANIQRAELDYLLTGGRDQGCLVVQQFSYMRALARVLRRHVAQALINQGASTEDAIRLAWSPRTPPSVRLFEYAWRGSAGSEQRSAA